MKSKKAHPKTMCNFPSMKSPMELNSLLLELMRDETGRLANEVFYSDLISLKQ